MMRRTIRHVAVLAAAVVMLTAIAVPAQGKGDGYVPKPPDVFEVTCIESVHRVYVEVADESHWYQRLYVSLTAGVGGVADADSGTGLVEVAVSLGVGTYPYHLRVELETWTRQTMYFWVSDSGGYC